MAGISAFSPRPSICTPISHRIPSLPLFITSRSLHFHTCAVPSSFRNFLTLKTQERTSKISPFRGIRKLRSVDEETQVSEVEASAVPEQGEQQTVSVPVSSSDTLTMYFQADGTLDELSIPKVTKALEETEGVTDLKVQLVEGIASVELKKQTTVQATGVASGLVELIQGSGFKLQTLNLSFEDEEDLLVV